MLLSRVLKRLLLSAVLTSTLAAAHAQVLPPDSVPSRPALLLKAGLRLTHLRYSRSSQAWQFLLPLSFGAEYRLAPAFSFFAQLDADVLTSYSARASRNAQASTLPAAALNAGLRYYYGHSKATDQHSGPEFGKYLALNGGAEWLRLGAANASRRRATPAALVPAVYALWGIQNRLRPHLLYDLNAGLGVLAPTHYYNYEYVGGPARWDVGAQVNIYLHLAN